MLTSFGHLAYCSNIHTGESWKDHFDKLKAHIPVIKERLSPDQSFGIGLRLSNVASLELRKEEQLRDFRAWLNENHCYVFTMNGFPYGSFHNTRVKDQVHAPDWTTADRVQYTIRLAQLLAVLLPETMDGGISTSPLSYRFWHKEEERHEVFEKATMHVLQVVEQLIKIKATTGKSLHLDIEPEPDGLLGESSEFLDWYLDYLLPMGTIFLAEKFRCSEDEAEQHIKAHVQLCYDVCHFAICYEEHKSVINRLHSLGIRTGKIQISAALKAGFAGDEEKRNLVIDAFRTIDEPTYLHQVVARQQDGRLLRYADMPDALADASNATVTEWRAHFHVPLFIENYGLLQSTRSDIEKVLEIHQQHPFTGHLEVETYTWEVLPAALRLPIDESIIRELQWVKSLIPEHQAAN
jgi:hypothetical protein